MVGAEYTVMKKGTNIIKFLHFVWDYYGNVKALCLILPTPSLAVYTFIRNISNLIEILPYSNQ